MESRTQGQGQGHKKNLRPRPRPRTALPRTDPLEAKAKDQGHKRKCSPKKRCSEKNFRRSQKKKVFRKFFQEICRKNRFPNNFSGAPQTFNNSKNSAVLEDRAIFEGLGLRGQGQGLQIVSSRTSSKPRTSSRTPPLLLIIIFL